MHDFQCRKLGSFTFKVAKLPFIGGSLLMVHRYCSCIQNRQVNLIPRSGIEQLANNKIWIPFHYDHISSDSHEFGIRYLELVQFTKTWY